MTQEQHKERKRKYRQTPEGKAKEKEYRLSEKAKETHRLYRQSERGKAIYRLYRQSEKSKLSDALYVQTYKGRAVGLVGSAKQRAKLKNLKFEIDVDFVLQQLEKNNYCCAVTGVALNLSIRGEGKKNPRAPSLDQKIPGNGYTKENTQITTVWFNLMKSDLTDIEAIGLLNEWREINEKMANKNVGSKSTDKS